MKQWILYLGGMLFILAGLLYISNMRPDLWKRTLLVVDKFGITDVGLAEKERVGRIMNLPIEYEKKQALIQRTIFIGATKEMMLLSFGQPKEQVPSAAAPDTEIWKYHFPGDSRPTVFRMENGVMVSACKGSVLDAEAPH